MIKDIVTELRYTTTVDRYPWDNTLYDRAADEIERLREQLEDARMYAEQDACEIERLYAEVNALRLQVVCLSIPEEAPRG